MMFGMKIMMNGGENKEPDEDNREVAEWCLVRAPINTLELCGLVTLWVRNLPARNTARLNGRI